MWHGILIDKAFTENFLSSLIVIGKKKSDGWVLPKIEVTEEDVEKSVQEIQKNMRDDFYSHLYSEDGNLIIIFKNKLFKIKSDTFTWNDAVEYGKPIGIPEEQLDFYPCRFEDEHIE
jgi:hypothetical protein